MVTKKIAREHLVQCRVSEDEHAMLDVVAFHSGLSASDVMRTLIRREYAEKDGAKSPKARLHQLTKLPATQFKK